MPSSPGARTQRRRPARGVVPRTSGNPDGFVALVVDSTGCPRRPPVGVEDRCASGTVTCAVVVTLSCGRRLPALSRSSRPPITVTFGTLTLAPGRHPGVSVVDPCPSGSPVRSSLVGGQDGDGPAGGVDVVHAWFPQWDDPASVPETTTAFRAARLQAAGSQALGGRREARLAGELGGRWVVFRSAGRTEVGRWSRTSAWPELLGCCPEAQAVRCASARGFVLGRG